jgi:hypothetical protein
MQVWTDSQFSTYQVARPPALYAHGPVCTAQSKLGRFVPAQPCPSPIPRLPC